MPRTTTHDQRTGEVMETVAVVIPTLNEERSIGKVIDDVPVADLLRNGLETAAYVADARSVDHTRNMLYYRKFEITQRYQNAGLGDCCGS